MISIYILLLQAISAFAMNTLQLTFTTDVRPRQIIQGPGFFGPDGPWQALMISLGNFTDKSIPGIAPSSPYFFDNKTMRGVIMPMWPSGGNITSILSTSLGGNYSLAKSSTWTEASSKPAEPYDWNAHQFLNSSLAGRGGSDIVSIPQKQDSSATANATLLVATEAWNVSIPSGGIYTPQVGILGLGPPSYRGDIAGAASGLPSILEQLKSQGKIGSVSFGLHMGSALMNQSGSMILGGYDQSRVTGPVGIFTKRGKPMFSLVDVFLGVESGITPFTQSGNISVYTGFKSNPVSRGLVKEFGGRRSTSLVVPNPALPYIYLPLGVCEKAAAFLPVSWNNEAKLFVWESNNIKYQRLMSSPAHLAFVIADDFAMNVTVRVPFQLLNLVLEPPLVRNTMRYFPCKPSASVEGVWELGRAFLQAAFLGINYEKNTTFIAQAPGPDMDKSVIRAINPGDVKILSNGLTSFEKSWSSSWTPLSLNATAQPINMGHPPLSPGAIAAIVSGVVTCFLLSLTLVLTRRRWMRKYNSNLHNEKDGNPIGAGGLGQSHEAGPPLAHELPSPPGLHEFPNIAQEFHELPSPNEIHEVGSADSLHEALVVSQSSANINVH